MNPLRLVFPTAALIAATFAPLSPASLAAETSFDRNLTVSGPVRLELSNGSGNVTIRGGSDGRVHIHGKVTSGWSMWGGSEKNLEEVAANPPIEQKGDTVRIGKNSWARNVSIEYSIELPRDTEVDASVASGGITLDNVRGPVKASSASGFVHVYRVEKDVTLSAASGSIDTSSIGGFLRINSASGDIVVADVKGEITARAASGSIHIQKPGDRVDATSASGSISVAGASNDLKINALSGSIEVSGDPSSNRFWELKSASGSVELRVPQNASFLLSAESASGDIRTSIPVVLEEQSKHSLRAHIGSSSGRVEVHTASGSVRVGAA